MAKRKVKSLAAPLLEFFDEPVPAEEARRLGLRVGVTWLDAIGEAAGEASEAGKRARSVVQAFRDWAERKSKPN